MTKVINFFGGPGVGKSTAATGVFSALKTKGVNCEYVSEYAKETVWEETNALLDNQLHIFAEQFRRQFRLVDKVDYIITDSPLILSCVYFDHWFKQRNTKMFDDDYCKLTKQYFLEGYRQFENVNWFIVRAKAYEPKGRLQTLKEAQGIDNDVMNYLVNTWTDYQLTDSVHAIEDATNDILGLPKRDGAPILVNRKSTTLIMNKRRRWWW